MRVILMLSLAILISSCNSNDENQEQITALEVATVNSNAIVIGNQISVFETAVENLRLRAAPDLSSEIVLTLKKNTRLAYLDEESEKRDSIKIGGKMTVFPWYKVKLINKEIYGWVFGGGVINKSIDEEKLKEMSVDCEGSEADIAKKYLAQILKNSDLEGKYELSCQLAPYFLKGNFDADEQEEIAIFIKENIATDAKIGILIGSLNGVNQQPVVLGAGSDYLHLDDLSDIGIFEKVDVGNSIAPNWNEETNDFYYEGDTIPEDKMVNLQTDAIFVHVLEACGGGFIYWKDNKYNWMHNE